MVLKEVRFLFFLTLTLGFLFGTTATGQIRDAGLWTSASFEVKVVKKLTATISQEFRFNENITELGTVFTDAGLTYKLNKHFQVAANYRFMQKRRFDNYYSFRHRLYIDLKYEEKIKPFQIQIRSRVQDQYADIGRASDGGIPEYYLRNKMSINLDLDKPYSPYISVELFSPLHYPATSAFDNIRTSAGVEYSFSKHHKADLFYMIQKELNVSRPETDFILGLGYSYKL
jgi:hypothetical protein